MTSRQATATPQVQGLKNPLLVPPNHPLPAAVGIVGAGTIGPDIGYYLKSAIPGLKLVLVDIDEEALATALKRIAAYVEKGLAKRKITQVQAEDIQQNLTTTTDYADLAECDWVIEAATENLELKRQIFSQIEAVVKPTSLITSNTSSLPAQRLFAHLEHPGRTTVTHFFAPAFRNPAVEVIEWEQSDPGMVLYLRGLFCATGKVPLVTSDALCFMLDRVFDNWCNEAALLLDKATPAQVDSVCNELVHAGPFFVLNLAHGNPIIVETNTLQMEEEGEHYRPADIFRTTETWDTLAPGKTIEVENELAAAIRDRMLGILISQAVDILDRGIGTPEDLDLGCVLALGFKKGPLELMNELGTEEVQRILERFSAERPGMPMPTRPLPEYLNFRRFLLVDEIDGVVVITLRRPQAMNALNDAVTDELLDVIREREDDEDVLGFVITGYGARSFCAGADIGSVPELLGNAEAAAGFARDCSRLLVHLDAMEKPVVAAINGMALGGGLELALRCHSMVATAGAWMQLPEVTLGIAPGIGALTVPYRRWPEAAAVFHDMLRLGRKLKAEDAHEMGILDGLSDDMSGLVPLALARVRQLSGKVTRIPDGRCEIAAPSPVEPRNKHEESLPADTQAIIEEAIVACAAAETFGQAIELGYLAFGDTACTDSAHTRINAFLGR